MWDQQSHLSVNWIEETVLAVRLYVYIYTSISLEIHYTCSFDNEPFN